MATFFTDKNGIEYVRLLACVTDVKFNKDDLEIFLVLDAEGKRYVRVFHERDLQEMVNGDMSGLSLADRQIAMLTLYNEWKKKREEGVSFKYELTREAYDRSQNA